MTGLKSGKFLGCFVTSFIGMVTAILAFTWIIDPFGLSPISIEISGINTVKIARINADRLVKLYDPLSIRPRMFALANNADPQTTDRPWRSVAAT
jgi:hypothetical protein